MAFNMGNEQFSAPMAYQAWAQAGRDTSSSAHVEHPELEELLETLDALNYFAPGERQTEPSKSCLKNSHPGRQQARLNAAAVEAAAERAEARNSKPLRVSEHDVSTPRLRARGVGKRVAFSRAPFIHTSLEDGTVVFPRSVGRKAREDFIIRRRYKVISMRKTRELNLGPENELDPDFVDWTKNEVLGAHDMLWVETGPKTCRYLAMERAQGAPTEHELDMLLEEAKGRAEALNIQAIKRGALDLSFQVCRFDSKSHANATRTFLKLQDKCRIGSHFGLERDHVKPCDDKIVAVSDWYEDISSAASCRRTAPAAVQQVALARMNPGAAQTMSSGAAQTMNPGAAQAVNTATSQMENPLAAMANPAAYAPAFFYPQDPYLG